MHESLEEAKQGNTIHMDKHDNFVCSLDSINLDMKDNLVNEYVSSDEELIDMDNDFPDMISTELTVTSSNKHSDSQSHFFEVSMISIVMDFIPLLSCHPSPRNYD